MEESLRKKFGASWGRSPVWRFEGKGYFGRMDANQITEKAKDWQEAAQDLTERAQNWTDRAKRAARQAGTAADQYVHENTWTTVAILTLAAVAIGFLLGRSSD